MRRITHPGPIIESRIHIGPCAGVPVSLVLNAGIPLEQAVAEAMASHKLESAYLSISQAETQTLAFVVPDHASDETHVAWYSKTNTFDRGRIELMSTIVGRHKGESFTHSHGSWTSLSGTQGMGHLLATHTVLAEPTVATGIGLHGARFERRHDPETAFDLFQVDTTAPLGECDCAAVRLMPNQDFATALDEACRRLHWTGARVYGLGSLIGAHFENGQRLDCHATEFMITDAEVGPASPEPEITIVGIDGDNILSGRLTRGRNAVLITAELVLCRQEGP